MMKFLNQAYLDTTYQVYLDSVECLDLRIGVYSETLADWLKSKFLDNWCVITAFNPFSRALSREENFARNAIMEKTLENLPVEVYKAKGIPSDDKWLAEDSFFVAGLVPDKFVELGIKFGQNAIVLGNQSAIPELIWLVEVCD
ncbi:MAG: DUF3293 domain-containing protein [Pseudomonadota bacterium]